MALYLSFQKPTPESDVPGGKSYATPSVLAFADRSSLYIRPDGSGMLRGRRRANAYGAPKSIARRMQSL
jgi:hypothetical protein